MKHKMTKLTALAMAAVLGLTACGGSTSTTATTAAKADNAATETTAAGSAEAADTNTSVVVKDDPISDWVGYITRSSEIETFFMLGSERNSDFEFIGNLYEGLLETDNYRRVKPALAESYGTEDGGKTWTFNIRDGVYWSDVDGNQKDQITAHDWVTGLEWILKFHKNGSTNTSMPMQTIEGAEEYYEYTKGLEEAEALALDKSKFLEMVGIEAVDDLTLKYTCTENIPYFDTVVLGACCYPIAQGFIDEVGMENVLACNNMNMWYSGAYLCTDYIQNNEKILVPNPNYWDTECTRFDSVTIKCLESAQVAFQLFQAGEVDAVAVSESTLKMIKEENPELEERLVEGLPNKSVYSLVFNYTKNNADGTPDTNWNTAIANENFRQSLFWGLDWTPFLAVTNSVNPLSQEGNTFTAPGACILDDGTDYTDLVKAEMEYGEIDGVTPVRFQPEKALEYKKAAMEELSAKGVTFPIKMAYWISASSQTALDKANILSQMISDNLGDDYIVLDIQTYVSSTSNEVYKPRLQSFSNNGWGADYGDPYNFLSQHLLGSDNAYYSKTYTHIDEVEDPELRALYETYTAMVEEASAITDDMAARYQKFAEAEAFFLSHALTVPTYQSVQWSLRNNNLYANPKTVIGCQTVKYKNWETSKSGYTTAEYELLKEQWYKDLESFKGGN